MLVASILQTTTTTASNAAAVWHPVCHAFVNLVAECLIQDISVMGANAHVSQ